MKFMDLLTKSAKSRPGTIQVGILTVSDRCSKSLSVDESGPALEKLGSSQGWEVTQKAIVPDDSEQIEKTLLDWSDQKNLSLILTTGGTGLGPRDITPETTKKVLEKELSSLSQWMQIEGSKKTPRALLSRGIIGSRGKSLIVNLPGSPKGAQESLSLILDLIPHALEMICGADHEK